MRNDWKLIKLPLNDLRRLAVVMLVVSHFGATLYWIVPSQRVFTDPQLKLSATVENVITPIFEIRNNLRSTYLAKYLRAYIRLFSLEQRWWLMSPNPPHYKGTIEVRIETNEDQNEFVWLRGFQHANDLKSSPGLREQIIVKKLLSSEFKDLLKDYATFGLRDFKSSHMTTFVRKVRVVSLSEKFHEFLDTARPSLEEEVELYLLKINE